MFEHGKLGTVVKQTHGKSDQQFRGLESEDKTGC